MNGCWHHFLLCTHTRPFNGPFSGLPGWAGTRKVKPIWILLKQETVSGSVISWAICKSAPRSRQITTPTPHCSVFYRPDAFPATHQQCQSTEYACLTATLCCAVDANRISILIGVKVCQKFVHIGFVHIGLCVFKKWAVKCHGATFWPTVDIDGYVRNVA